MGEMVEAMVGVSVEIFGVRGVVSYGVGKLVRRRDKTAKLYFAGMVLRGAISVPVVPLLCSSPGTCSWMAVSFSPTVVSHLH
jgi:hypothetical protein